MTNAEKPRRPFGAGSVERDRNKFRARIRTIDGKTTLGTFDTEAEAHEVLDAYFLERAEKKAPLASVVSIKTIGPKFLDFREQRGLRSVDTDRDRWNAHIATAFFAEWPLREVSAKNVREWRDSLMSKRATRVVKGGTKLIPKRAATKRRLSRSSRKSTLNLLRQAFEWAIEQDLIPANPAHGIKLEKELRTEEPWTFLTPAEQELITTTPDVPLPERTIIKFLIGTGLRKGEAWALRLCDVHVKGERPHVMVRFGSPGKPPKNGKIRRVPLFDSGLEAAIDWLAALPAYAKRNPLGLMFPTRRGYRRHRRAFRAEWRDEKGKRIKGKRTMTWPEILAAAGIERPVRIHDLRHTCGSSLVAGWWGRTWTLVEVRDLLGHSQISVTERYAHLAQSALEKAARETVRTAPHLARAATGADHV